MSLNVYSGSWSWSYTIIIIIIYVYYFVYADQRAKQMKGQNRDATEMCPWKEG